MNSYTEEEAKEKDPFEGVRAEVASINGEVKLFMNGTPVARAVSFVFTKAFEELARRWNTSPEHKARIAELEIKNEYLLKNHFKWRDELAKKDTEVSRLKDKITGLEAVISGVKGDLNEEQIETNAEELFNELLMDSNWECETYEEKLDVVRIIRRHLKEMVEAAYDHNISPIYDLQSRLSDAQAEVSRLVKLQSETHGQLLNAMADNEKLEERIKELETPNSFYIECDYPDEAYVHEEARGACDDTEIGEISTICCQTVTHHKNIYGVWFDKMDFRTFDTLEAAQAALKEGGE